MNVAASFSNLCRLCLEPHQASIPIFRENDTGVRELFDKMSVCLPVKLSEDDCLPKNICSSCHKSVDFIYNFWQISSNSEKQLKTMVENIETVKNDYDIQECIGASPENTLILYETLDDKDTEDREDEDVPDTSNIEIKEVYFGEYLNQCDTIEDENTVLINEDLPQLKSDTNNLGSEILLSNVNDDATAQSNNVEDIQISQIVESSNVSLRTFDEENSLKLKLWDVALPDFFLIPYGYEAETHSVDPNAVVLMDLQKSALVVPEKSHAFICDICETTFNEQLPYLKHYENVHKQFKCPFCAKSFIRRSRLENHLFVHSTRRDFPCTMCSMKFKRDYDLKQHVKRMHNKAFETRIFHCDNCSYKTKHKNQMRIHALGHLGISLFSCDLCGKTFKTNLDFTVHQNNHLGIKPFQCDICGNHFSRKHHMLQHRRTMHEESCSSYQCDICGRSFAYRSSLSIHLKSHTGENRVQCDICHKIVSSKVVLANHKKIHSDEKEFVCGICGKVYINKYSLQEHVLVHTGSKPFQCLQCDKSFSTRKKLLNHEQIHDPVRSLYYCNFCDKSYLSKYKLNEHMEKRH